MTPSGLPAWSRTASHTYYGGNVNKRNLLSVGAIDAQTDLTAEEFTRLCADLAALVTVAPFAVMTFTINAGSNPTVLGVKMMTGVTSSSYAGGTPPAGFPTLTDAGTGLVDVTFSSSYSDPYGVSQAFAPVDAMAQVRTSSLDERDATVNVSGQVVRVRCLNSAGTLVAGDTISLAVW